MTFKSRLIGVFSAVLIGHTILLWVVASRRIDESFAEAGREALGAGLVAGRSAFLNEASALAGTLDRILAGDAEVGLLRDAARGVRRRDRHDVVNAATRLKPDDVSMLRILDRSGIVLSSSPDPERFGSHERDLASLATIRETGPWIRSVRVLGRDVPALVDARPTEDLFVVAARVLDDAFFEELRTALGGRAFVELGADSVIGPVAEDERRAIAAGDTTASDGAPLTVARDRVIASTLVVGGGRLWIARTDDVLPDLRRRLTRSALLIGGVGLLVAWLVALVLTRSLSEPLRELTVATARVAAGQWDKPIRVSGSVAEVRSLQRAFDRMQRDLLRQQTELRRAERAAAWRDAARRIAHEIKNALTPLQLNWERLRTMTAEGDIQPDVLQASSESISRQLSILRRFLGEFSELARWPEATLVEIDITDLARSTVDLYRGNARASLVLDANEPVRAFADAGQLTRALANLIQNALDATSDRGRIVVSVRLAEPSVLLSVADDGPGMSEDTISGMFTPYFTTRDSGTGLGLSIVERIVDAHHGHVDVTSAPGHGTTITIRWPRTPDRHV